MTGRAATSGSFSWTSHEIAWPLALAAGFAGTLLGLSLGVPGAPLALATAGFAPIFLAQVREGQGGLAALLGLAWCLGIVGAVLGGALDRAQLPPGPWPAPGTLPLAGRVEAELRLQAGGLRLDATALLARLAWASAAVLAARPSRGVASLALVALAVGAAAGGAAPLATAAARAGAAVPALLLAATPLFALIQAAGVLAAVGALCSAGDGSAPGPAWRAGAGLAVAGMALEVLLGPPLAARLAALAG